MLWLEFYGENYKEICAQSSLYNRDPMRKPAGNRRFRTFSLFFIRAPIYIFAARRARMLKEFEASACYQKDRASNARRRVARLKDDELHDGKRQLGP